MAVTLLSWPTTRLNSSSVPLISARGCRGLRVPLTLRKRWSCLVTTLRWFARCTTMLLGRLVPGKLTHPTSARMLLTFLPSFTLREGGKTIGTGIITKVLEYA